MAPRSSKRKADQFEGIAGTLAKLGKLGLGALTHPETERWIAFTLLFAHMEAMMVDDLQQLRDSCLPPYRALHEIGREIAPDDHSDFPALVIREVLPNHGERESVLYVKNWSSLCQAGAHFTEAKKLTAAISIWAETRHMTTDLFLDGVLMNLLGWRMQPELAQGLRWTYPGMLAAAENHRIGVDARRLHGQGTLDRLVPTPVIKPYNPSAQTREEHRADFALQLSRYHLKQEEAFVKAGFRPTTLKRARTEKNPWVHFEWFIRFQMQGKTGSEIAEKYRLRGLGEDAIYRALKALATILKVNLRPRIDVTAKT